ncbi:MAG: DUF499 domain-containing protein [Bacillota bacterium]
MISTPTFTPWHKVVRLRDDLRSGELPLAIFAADLYAVRMATAPPVYRDPREFFSLTYPAHNLRRLAKEVMDRLAGGSERAVRQLELTYGGGKTHALITLYHLVNDPETLPEDLPAVREFIVHAGQRPPKARVAVLAFDKLDVEKGMEVPGPDGRKRWLRHPWSVLAYQLAGSEGLRLLHAADRDEERESPPAENLLTELLAIPARADLATLILIDEVLMYAREKVALDPTWRARLVDFCQYLTQATTAVPRCAIVASLLATDPRKYDSLGRELAKDLSDIFRREKEESIQPVLKEDVAEILRRRFFTPESTRDHELFRPHVIAALQGIQALDEATARQGPEAEERYLASYPFHPDLTDVFYTKWTNLEGFQRTRGILRTFALALREAERWDTSPLVAANVFLSEPGRTDLSPAARELTGVAATEEYEGKRQEWTAILEGELAKARAIQEECPALRHREVEQAVFATFLHSQPATQKALTRELMVLVGATCPDRIELGKALRRWAEVSWFLDEAGLQDVENGPQGERFLPRTWRLGSRPNLTQMHHDACGRVSAELVEARLLEDIARTKDLTAGAGKAGARVHTLPEAPNDISDDWEFHYAVLGPKAASEPGKPSAEAVRFLTETSGPQKPRVNQNAVVLAVPAREGLEIARSRVRDYLGWEEVAQQLKEQKVHDPLRTAALNAHLDASRKAIPAAVQQAYCIVVTIGRDGGPEAFRVTVGDRPLFEVIKADERSRIRESAVDAGALLPGGPYDLWEEGETSRRMRDLVGSFAQFPRLPKMLNSQAILDTLLAGCQSGLFVMRLTRPDRSVRTFWRERPDDVAVKDPSLEVVLPQGAALTELAPSLLEPGALPGLWPQEGRFRVGDLYAYFAGGHSVAVSRGTYEETVVIPAAPREVVDVAVRAAVREAKVWLLAASGAASVCEEDIPPGLLTENATLQGPPEPLSPTSILPDALPAAWPGPPPGSVERLTSALAILDAASARAGLTLPWAVVRRAIDGALRTRLLELADGSGPWPCELTAAKDVRLRERKAGGGPVPPEWPKVAQADLEPNELQELADQTATLLKVAGREKVKYHVRIELSEIDAETLEQVANVLLAVSPRLRLKESG